MSNSPFILKTIFLCLFALCSAQRNGRTGFSGLRFMEEEMSLSDERLSGPLDGMYGFEEVYVGSQDGSKEADRIESLPGQPNGVDFGQFAGYVTVDPVAGRILSLLCFGLMEARPGCSSFGNGAMTELGQFRVNKDGTLYRNEYAWNLEANVIFLESPAGVGFSYSNTTTDYELSGDNQTAHDSYTFLVNWLERFPEYKSRDFYLTGESYAGHYVPQLAQMILRNNNYPNRTTINLRGIVMGNAYVDSEDNKRGAVDYYWKHALISDEIYGLIISNCNFLNISDECKVYLTEAHKAMGSIDHYNIYAPICDTLYSNKSSYPFPGFDPCSDRYVSKYLNNPEVQRSLHANISGIPYTWESCSDTIGRLWKDKPLTVLPVIQGLMSEGLRIWVYSGDIDSVVPVTSTQYSIKKHGTPVKTSWYPWYTQGEVGGYVVGYENLTFVTVRGSGHLVPSYQPARALQLFASFLNGTLPPAF